MTVQHLIRYTPSAIRSISGTGRLSTAYGYNLDGALIQVLLPDESTVTHGYDTAGRLASVTTARGTTIVGYDAAGRVGSLIAPDGGQVSLAYDGFLKTAETWTGAVAGSVGYSYDNDFRVAGVSVNGSSDAYQYDPDGLLAQAGALTITRDAATGWIGGTTIGQVTTTQNLSQYGELGSFSAKANGSEVLSYTLDRDAAGRIFRKTESIGGTTTIYGYEYDDAGRVATASRNGTAVSTYSYDANGNRLTGPVSQIGTYDDQDRMVAYGSATYTYGPNGDLRTKTENGQTTLYAYDALGNLVAATLPDGTLVEYLVDGKNRRIGKKLNGQLVEGFLYEGELKPVAWLNGEGQVYARFVYGPRLNVPEYMVTAAGTFRIVADHLGSPRLIINTTSGAIAQRLEYDEWGNVLQDTAPGFQPFGFAGGLFDRDTGLVRFGARDYDPQTGRWANKDPIRFDGGLNLYAYVGGDPVNMTDADGLDIHVNWDLQGDKYGPLPHHWLGETKIRWITGAPGECTCKCPDKDCKFDVTVNFAIWKTYVNQKAKSKPSGDTPGATVAQHEDLHVGDLQRDLSADALNSAFQTEGFPTRQHCESKRAQFDSWLRGHILAAEQNSFRVRDTAQQ